MIGICKDCNEEKPLKPRGNNRYYSWCVDCQKVRNKAYYQANKDKCYANGKRWVDKNREKHNATCRNSYVKNKDRHRKNVYDWRVRNEEKQKAYTNFRRRRQRSATPPWANLLQIKQMYMFAQHISKKTGIKHHVDHVIPLNGEFVSGLHVIENLAVVPALDNIRKSNQFDMFVSF